MKNIISSLSGNYVKRGLDSQFDGVLTKVFISRTEIEENIKLKKFDEFLKYKWEQQCESIKEEIRTWGYTV